MAKSKNAVNRYVVDENGNQQKAPFESYIPLIEEHVSYLAKTKYNVYYAYDDILQRCFVAALTAYESYDPERGAFITMMYPEFIGNCVRAQKDPVNFERSYRAGLGATTYISQIEQSAGVNFDEVLELHSDDASVDIKMDLDKLRKGLSEAHNRAVTAYLNAGGIANKAAISLGMDESTYRWTIKAAIKQMRKAAHISHSAGMMEAKDKVKKTKKTNKAK